MSTVSLPKPIIMLCCLFFFSLFTFYHPISSFFFFSVTLEQISIMFYMFLIHISFLHVQSLGWSPDSVCVNHQSDKKSRVTPYSYSTSAVLYRCLGILMQKRMKIHASSVFIPCSCEGGVYVCACARMSVCVCVR